MSNTLSVLKVNILAGALDTLSKSMTVAKIVNTNTDLSGATAQKGDTISFSNPAAQAVADVTPAAVPPALTDTAITETTVQLSNWKNTRFSLTDQEAAAIMNPNGFVTSQANESARALGEYINSSAWSCYKSVYGYAGTAGTNPFATNINPIADARKTLNDQLCPKGNRFAVFSNASEAAALKLGTFNTAYSRGSDVTLNSGELGDLYGFHCYADEQVPTHTAGTITTGAIAKASTVQAVGVTSVTCTTAASTGAVALKQGDIVTFSGDSQTYVVGADVTQASASTDFTLTISPAKVVALAGSETLAVKASHEVNLAFDPAAFALALRAPSSAMPGMDSEDSGMTMVEPKTGIPLRLDLYRGFHAWQVELSILFGVKIIDPRRGRAGSPANPHTQPIKPGWRNRQPVFLKGNQMELPTIKLFHRDSGEMAVWNVADQDEANAAGYFVNPAEPVTPGETPPDEPVKAKIKAVKKTANKTEIEF